MQVSKKTDTILWSIAQLSTTPGMLVLQATCHGRNVKKALLPAPLGLPRQHTVALCGDILLHRKIFSDTVSKAAGLALIRCPEDRDQVFSIRQQRSVSLFITRQAFIEQMRSVDIAQLTNYGMGSSVLAILESDTVDTASAAKMLRLGCRGVLPRQSSPKLFRRAALAILRGEVWAPRTVISELLSDLIRTASLKAESGLTPQEARILELTLQGNKNSAIADALFISLETVRWHKRRLNRKLRAPGRIPHAKLIPPAQEIAAG